MKCENPFQELVWKHITVQKLDQLNKGRQDSRISTQPGVADILSMLNEILKHFVVKSEASTGLNRLADLVLELWNALRYDQCRPHFEFNPSLSSTQDWDEKPFQLEDPSAQVPASGRELPSGSFALFPRITIYADGESTKPHKSSRGLALRGSSPAFLISHHEDKAFEADVNRARRAPSISFPAQISPVQRM